MKRILLMKNTVQEYAWGSITAIPRLLGTLPDPRRPQAELWMGAHPKAPSLVNVDGAWQPLDELIARHPQSIMGESATRRFGHRLPYLFKVLAAARPLSLQAHPSRSQARAGFERENRQQVSLADPTRNYKDDNHKPEILCALSPFWAMAGFRSIRELLALSTVLDCPEFNAHLMPLRQAVGGDPFKRFFRGLMTLAPQSRKRLADAVLEAARQRSDTQPVFQWIAALGDAYPGDIGLLAPIWLNLFRLRPGEAVYLPAGQLHAYLEGTGIELMANSDNVLRGGLTPKHIDVDELLAVLDFAERPVSVLAPRPNADGERVYGSLADEFVLSAISVVEERRYRSPARRSVEILLCTDGRASVLNTDDGQRLPLVRGSSLLVPAALSGYAIEGRAELFKAAVPLDRTATGSR